MNVTINQVDFPRPGGKYGKLITNGGIIMVPPNLLGQFQAGWTGEIGTKTQVWGQGTDREAVVTVATTGPNGAVIPQNRALGQQQLYAGQGTVRPNTGFQPRVIQGGGAKSAEEQRNMFIMGVVGRAMGSGKFSASEIPVLTQAALQAWDGLTPRPTLAPTPDGDPGPQEAI